MQRRIEFCSHSVFGGIGGKSDTIREKNMIVPKTSKRHIFLKWSATFALLGAMMYPIIIGPMLNSDEYKKIQKSTRQGIDQEKIQPGTAACLVMF